MTARRRSALPALRAALRQPRGRLALLALMVLAVGAGWYVTTRGGWVNALRLPPTLDASTPRSQNGWVLETIQLPGQQQDQYSRPFNGFQHENVDYDYSDDPRMTDTEDAFGLWLTPPPGSVASTTSIDAQNTPLGKVLTVTARLSSGEVLPLDWHFRRQQQWVGPGEAGNHFLLVTLPTGYPDTCRFVDFDASDQNGHIAHWRVTRLPRMRHAIAPPVKITDTVTKNGITMSVQAWHQAYTSGPVIIQTVMRPVLPGHSHQWDLVTTQREHEWEPFGYTGQQQENISAGPSIQGRNGVFDNLSEHWLNGMSVNQGNDFYPHSTHFLRVTTKLRQYETYEEPVTFHNLAVAHESNRYYLVLPKPQSATTPSGITVTLPAQGKPRPYSFSDGLTIIMTVRPVIKPDSTAYTLPSSPLTRTFGKPVQLSLDFPQPYSESIGSFEQNGQPAFHTLRLPTERNLPFKILPVPPVLKNFTIIVHQRVDLQTIPMTFIVPIADHAPQISSKGPSHAPTR